MIDKQRPYSIEWIVIPAPNVESAKKFYAEVFHFEVSDFSENFAVFKAGNLSGGLDRQLTPSRNSVSFSVTVDDIPKLLGDIETHGGKTVKPKYSLGPNAGFCAQFEDPNGNLLELYCET